MNRIALAQRAALVLLLAPLGSAADITVTADQTIQAAIDSSVSGDRILVQPGTYIEQLDFGGRDIQVIGVQGSAMTTINAAGNGPVVRFSGGETPTTRLAGLTITGGNFAGFGAGGIQCLNGSTPSIEDCVIQGNTGKFGGGVSGSPLLRRSFILNNTSSLTPGGGIHGAPQMRYCVVAGNRSTSADGGGLYLTGGSSIIEDCIFIENAAVFANSAGGGIYVTASATAQIRRCVIANNFGTGGAFVGRGGGVYAEALGVSLENCSVLENSLSGSSAVGAGLFGPLAVNNCIVRDNLGGSQIADANVVTYSSVSGGYVGVGNVDLAPGFVDSSNRDWHLTASSPLIDLGDPALLDADLSRSDIGAYDFRTMYTRSNTRAVDWASPSWPEISVTLGGTQVLQILGGAQSANQFFWTLGSASGTSPGFQLLGVHVPLNVDAYLIRVGRNPNTGVLSNSLGSLDSNGNTQTIFHIGPDLNASAAGTQLHHAAVLRTSNPNQPVRATQPEPLLLVQ